MIIIKSANLFQRAKCGIKGKAISYKKIMKAQALTCNNECGDENCGGSVTH